MAAYLLFAAGSNSLFCFFSLLLISLDRQAKAGTKKRQEGCLKECIKPETSRKAWQIHNCRQAQANIQPAGKKEQETGLRLGNKCRASYGLSGGQLFKSRVEKSGFWEGIHHKPKSAGEFFGLTRQSGRLK